MRHRILQTKLRIIQKIKIVVSDTVRTRPDLTTSLTSLFQAIMVMEDEYDSYWSWVAYDSFKKDLPDKAYTHGGDPWTSGEYQFPWGPGSTTAAQFYFHRLTWLNQQIYKLQRESSKEDKASTGKNS